QCMKEIASCGQMVEAFCSVDANTAPILTSKLASNNANMVEVCLNLLATLCVREEYRQAVVSAGGVQMLPTLLTMNDANVRRQIVRLIGSLCSSEAVDDPVRDLMGELGCLPTIISALETPDPEIQQEASFALKHCCRSFLCRVHLSTMGAI